MTTPNELGFAEVEEILRVQGFEVPREDLEEITYRLNAMILGLTTLAAEWDLTEIEPWPTLGPR